MRTLSNSLRWCQVSHDQVQPGTFHHAELRGSPDVREPGPCWPLRWARRPPLLSACQEPFLLLFFLGVAQRAEVQPGAGGTPELSSAFPELGAQSAVFSKARQQGSQGAEEGPPSFQSGFCWNPVQPPT